MNIKSRTRVTAIIAWILFWILMASVAVQDYARDGGHEYWQPILWESSSIVMGAALMLLQRRLLRRYDYLTATPWRWFALNFSALPVFCVLWVPAVFAIRHGVYALVGEVYTHRPWASLFLYESVKVAVFFSMFTVILFGVLSWHELLEEKLRAEQATSRLRQAQLQRLTQQMQPHFLFNALNTVSSLMHTDVARADATLVQLADTLRAALEVSEQQVAPLSTELRLVRGYARVMEERYADRVRIDWDIDDAALPCLVPVMSLQPLLENVFKHTVERRRGNTAIRIAARRDGAVVELSVQDDAGALQAATDGPGIGLANLRARLAALHDAAASLELRQLEPSGVLAVMRLPCAC
ncbi:MAG: sensor histidine kinase [Telluria sp.]